ncbi:MAG TPA: ABC transporter permease, partial [Thermoanaerobaculia bacterium]
MPPRRSFRFPRRTASQVAADVEEELAFHLDRVAEELIAGGWPREEARVEARRRFGDLETTRQVCRALDASKERQMKWMERLAELGQDLRFAGRQLWKSPGFTLVAVLTLALGIGATTAIFSIVYGVLLRPLPFEQPERLVRPYFVDPTGETHGAFSPPNFLDFKAASRMLSDVTSVENGTLNLSGDGAEPQRLQAARVGANFFKVMGLRPLKGRTFAPGEDRPGAPRVAVISEKLWWQRFGGDSGLLGRSLTLDGQPYTVIGILRKGAQLPSAADVWVPKVFSPQELKQRGAVYFSVIGRLAPGATLRQARAEADVIGRRLATQYPKANASYFNTMTVDSLEERMLGDTRKPLLILLGAVGFVLLIACVNVANLLLVRAAAREGEIVIRAALGAGRGRLVRQMVTEGMLLSFTGGALGLLIARFGMAFLAKLAPTGFSVAEQPQLDGRLLAFTVALALLTGLLFSIVPALQASRASLNDTLRQGGRGGIGGRRPTTRDALVVLEVAAALVLLVGAGLMLKTLARLRAIDIGFRSDHLLTIRTAL